jgi:26S proteasome regulatory subunit N3
MTTFVFLPDLYTNISLLEKGVISKDARMISRVLRSSHSTARRLTAALLRPVIEHCFPVDAAERAVLLAHIDRVPAPAAVAVVAVADEVMVDAAAVSSSSSSSSSAASASEGSESSSSAAAAAVVKPKKAPLAPKLSITPEVEAYLHLIVLTFLCAFGGDDAASLACSSELLARIQSFNRRTLDQISARAWAQYALLQERRGREALAALRPALLAAHRTACLRHDEPSQAVLINLILRNYLEFGLYAHADKFRLNAAFPENRSNYQHARYLYYTGRINVVQLDYSDAYTHLTEVCMTCATNDAL